LDAILDSGKWFATKDVEELRGAIYKIIEDAVLVEWRKEFPNKDEIMMKNCIECTNPLSM
jgi:hypothetical protein